jgi:hypothetical protein
MPGLFRLVASESQLTPAALDNLAAFPSLTNVTIEIGSIRSWRSGMDLVRRIAAFRKRRPDVWIQIFARAGLTPPSRGSAQGTIQGSGQATSGGAGAGP